LDGGDLATGFWIDGRYIFTTDGYYTQYWLDGIHFFAPNGGYTGYWLAENHIYGPDGYTHCWIKDNVILGDRERLPWAWEWNWSKPRR
jgi:hypothetical protein